MYHTPLSKAVLGLTSKERVRLRSLAATMTHSFRSLTGCAVVHFDEEISNDDGEGMTGGDLNRQWLLQAQRLALAQGPGLAAPGPGLAQGPGIVAVGQGLAAVGQGLGAPRFSEAEMENARKVLEFLHNDEEEDVGRTEQGEQGGGGRGEQGGMDNLTRAQSQYRYVPAPEQGLPHDSEPFRRPSGASIQSNNSSCRFLCSPVSGNPIPPVDNSGSLIETSDSHSQSLFSHIGSRVTFGHSSHMSGEEDSSGRGDSGNGHSGGGSGGGSGSGSNGSVRTLSWLLGNNMCPFEHAILVSLVSFYTNHVTHSFMLIPPILTCPYSTVTFQLILC